VSVRVEVLLSSIVCERYGRHIAVNIRFKRNIACYYTYCGIFLSSILCKFPQLGEAALGLNPGLAAYGHFGLRECYTFTLQIMYGAIIPRDGDSGSVSSVEEIS
jgi:hypothetical protein